MEGFFNNLTGSLSNSFFRGGNNPFSHAQQQAAAFAQQAMDPRAGGGNKGPPPASHKALRQLPTITVSPEDLVDENNRECCICLEENHLKDRVLRLPCAHIFHQRCIIDWLTKHCTCPVCRYELETEDAQYEKHRKARMKARKPRVHTYELERMSLPELKQMATDFKISWPRRVTNKQDIIDAFIRSGRIDVIAAPKPVEYQLQVLRDMGVGKLRRTMEDAGVFFDPIDVVEKEDMVRIFCNSGRLVLLPDKAGKFEADQEFDIEAADDDIGDDRKPAAVGPNATSSSCRETEPVPIENRSGLVVETVSDEDDGPEAISYSDVTYMFDGYEDERRSSHGDDDEIIRGESMRESNEHEASYVSSTDDAVQEDTAQAPQNELPSEGIETAMDSSNDEEMAADYALLENYSISDLRIFAQQLNVDLSQCIERSEMVDKLVQARNGRGVRSEDLDQWSVSELRALAAAIHADLSHCDNNRGAMIAALVTESRTRPYAANYLNSLMPLARLTISQLRAVAREWRVNVHDCLEKEEMIHRLVAAAVPTATRA